MAKGGKCRTTSRSVPRATCGRRVLWPESVHVLPFISVKLLAKVLLNINYIDTC